MRPKIITIVCPLIAVMGLFIAGLGIGMGSRSDGQGSGSTITWIGIILAFVFVSVPLLITASQVKKSKNEDNMQLVLPELTGVAMGLRHGRNIYEGYQRGWGLQYNGLREKILADSLYKEAFAVSNDRTIVNQDNRMNIYLLLRFFLEKIPFGHIVEYGAYRGGNAIFMAYVVKRLYPGMKVFALDSFEGMPTTDKSVDAHNLGDFSDVDLNALQSRIDELKLDNLILVKGFFEDTNDKVMKQAGNISLAHIDCDIASAVQYSYENVKSFMVEGGYIVFDDATVSSCIGATEVVENLVIRRDKLNSEQIWPHYVFRAFKQQI